LYFEAASTMALALARNLSPLAERGGSCNALNSGTVERFRREI
jgi:hypothetical protein